MRSWILSAKESFWFLPAAFGIAAVVLAQGLVVVDQVFAGPISDLPFFSQLSADGGRSILTTIATSMLTVAGTSFSITISVLATTSSTYGPRLVRNFMADRANQFVLAMFTSTFLYCLVVLRSVRTAIDGRAAFVPTLGIHLAVLIAIVDAAVLVFFIHHIATSVQITTLQKRVQTDLVRAVDRAHPPELAHGWSALPVSQSAMSAPVRSAKEGYVQQVDLDDLFDLARSGDAVVRVAAMPGDHVVTGDPIVLVEGPEVTAETARRVRAAFAIGVERTPTQDLRFALQQLIEVAVRGLASGTNDPYTTVSALELSRAALIPLVSREGAPSTRLDDHGRPRLVVDWPSAEELVGAVFDSLRQYGLDHPIVVRAGLDLADRLGRETSSASVRAVLTERIQQLLAAFEASSPDEADLARIEGRGAAVLDGMRRSSSGRQ